MQRNGGERFFFSLLKGEGENICGQVIRRQRRYVFLIPSVGLILSFRVLILESAQAGFSCSSHRLIIDRFKFTFFFLPDNQFEEGIFGKINHPLLACDYMT